MRNEMSFERFYDSDDDVLATLNRLAQEAETAAQRKNRGIESLIQRLDTQFISEQDTNELLNKRQMAYFKSVHEGIIYLLDEAKRKNDLSEFINLVRIIEKAVKAQKIRRKSDQRQSDQVSADNERAGITTSRTNRSPSRKDRAVTGTQTPPSYRWSRVSRRGNN